MAWKPREITMPGLKSALVAVTGTVTLAVLATVVTGPIAMAAAPKCKLCTDGSVRLRVNSAPQHSGKSLPSVTDLVIEPFNSRGVSRFSAGRRR
jgi:hypothetical protein